MIMMMMNDENSVSSSASSSSISMSSVSVVSSIMRMKDGNHHHHRRRGTKKHMENNHNDEKEEEPSEDSSSIYSRDPLFIRDNTTTTTTTRQTPFWKKSQPRQRRPPRRWIFHIFTSVLFLASLASLFQVIYFHVEFLPFFYSSTTHQHQQRLFLMESSNTALHQQQQNHSNWNQKTSIHNNTNNSLQVQTTTIQTIVPQTNNTKNHGNASTTSTSQQQQQQQPYPTVPAAESTGINPPDPNTTATALLLSEEEDLTLRHAMIPSDLATYLLQNPLYRNLRQAMGESLMNHTEILKAIPSLWTTLHQLYYKHNDDQITHQASTNPIVVGMDTCAQYRAQVPYERRYTGVAGLFNTGTNAMEFHLRKNLQLPSRWQVPWGKHRPAFVRKKHVADFMQDAVQEDALPIIMVRDPLFWMQSMCKNSYAALWKHTPRHCPNLVPTAEDLAFLGGKVRDPATTEHSFNVSVHYPEYTLQWDSLAHLYSDFYNQYLRADYPRLFVRFEDILVNAPAVLAKIAECTGATLAPKVVWQTQSAKNHGSGTNFVKAIWKTGDRIGRVKSMTPADLDYARRYLDEHLLELFHYHLPDSLQEERAAQNKEAK